MCTAATYKTKDFYFGRTLDYEFSYGEEVTVTPRHFPLVFRDGKTLDAHYAMIGMAHMAEGVPLYYDGVNEKGLGMAGLNFVGNAHYREWTQGKDNITQFELIPWILGQCAHVGEARELLGRLNLWNLPFNARLPVAQLHWMISDRESSVTVEVRKGGVEIHENPVGVLTNNPPFEMQMSALNNYRNLSAGEHKDTFAEDLSLQPYSRGMGAIGLPGDWSSQSRFVRAAFVKMNSVSGEKEGESVSQFFHILNAVDQPRGCCRLGEGTFEITIYTSCCNGDRGIYYYTTYDNHQIAAVDMHRENLDGWELARYQPVKGEQIRRQN